MIFTEITSLKWNGVPFPPRLQKHMKCKANKCILDAPLASEMLNVIPMMWFLMRHFHFHGNGRKTWESRSFRWNIAFWRSAGHQNAFVLLAFPMLLQPGGKRYPIPLQTCDFSENHLNITEVRWVSLNSHTWVQMGALSPAGWETIGNTSNTKVFLMPRWPQTC